MRRHALVLAAAAAVAVAVATPVLLLADVSSCSLATSSYTDAVLNPPRGEDTDFFVSSGGVPNLMFLIDTSGSMRRLAPDGAAGTWGSFERPGNTVPGAGYGCTNTFGNSRVFSSPCGTTTLDGSPYNPTPGSANPNDYAEAKDVTGRYCPYMVSGNQPAKTDKPGFDPDWYPAFFAKDRVHKDNSWTDYVASPESEASVGAFCADTGYTAGQQASCSACMRDQGYWFDGTYEDALASARRCASTSDCASHGEGVCVTTSEDAGLEYSGETKSGYCRVPNVYFHGNFLNFFPPKFIMARKVFKDVLMEVRRVRLGVTTFNGSAGGNLLDKLNPGCNMFGSPSAFDSNRSSLLADINNLNKIDFHDTTPLAEALFNIGQYYRAASLPWFDGTTYKSTSWNEGAGQGKSVCFSCQASAVLVISDGLPNRDGRIPGTDYAATAMSLAVANTPGSYAGMAGYNIKGISTADCPSCETWAELADTAIAAGKCNGNQDSGACDDALNPVVSYLPRVAWYLHNMDFRPESETGSDGFPFAGKQALTTYTIGLGTRGAASEILRHTAEAGGGLYNGGTGSDIVDVRTLKDAIMRVLDDVNTRSTSFGSASLSTLQVNTTQGVLVPRFEPARTAHWDGHLYAFDLYSEFTSGTCTPADPATSGPTNGDYDCDGKCNSVFLKDAEGHFIQEDGAGAFKKSLSRNRAACGNGSRCTGASCSGPDPVAAAVAFWDAGSKLAPIKKSVDAATGTVTETANADFRTEWDDRRIFTVIDRSGDGKLTSDDMPLVDLRTADPATLVPYLNLRGTRYCGQLSQRLTSAGNPAGATIDAEIAAGTYTTCARMLLYYVRGADIFNERFGSAAPCGTYPSPANPTGAYCTRKYQLGDVFHSSPQEVWAPLPSDGYSCPRGLSTQCITSLFSGSIPNPSLDGYGSAYDDYSKSSRYSGRRKFVLVGANDGMLHAFQVERTVGTSGTPNPHMGEEIWAFVPPDLLPKLRLLTEAVHHFYVDGTPMVRDVWWDGGQLNKLHGGGTRGQDGVRQGDEFHTVAVIGERRGGTHYFALDVTDASDDLDAQPSFLWIYPQPNDPEQLKFGETYSEFTPVAPPIGPVRLDRGAAPCTGDYPQFGTRCFEERWIVFLSGGFDPTYTKGRGVHMVDLATGEEIWDFSQPAGAGSSCDSTDDPRCKLNYPVAATVGMSMWGSRASFDYSEARAGYFDTATFGDTGGQLWALRFSEPGRGWTPGGGTRVTNWYGGRIFQSGLSAGTPSCGLDYCAGSPFFYISQNAGLAANGLMRVLAGTGDRFNLLDPVGGVCSPENLRACLQKGCTVKLQDASGNAGAVFGIETLLGTQSYEMSGTALCASTPTGDFTFAQSGGNPAGTCGTSSQKIDALTISCPSTLTCSGSAETTAKRVSVNCTASSCDAGALNDFGSSIDLKGNPDKVNGFYSVQVFESSGPRAVFRTADEARAYDNARLTEADLKNVNAYDASQVPANLASPSGKGWWYYFNHGESKTSGAVTISIGGLEHNIYRADERTASVSAVEENCGFWNTMQSATPVGALDPTTECPVNSPCKAGRSQISYLYGADPATGGFCMYVDGALARAQRHDTLVPPHMGKKVAYVAGGQVAFGLTSVRVPQGGANVALGAAKDVSTQLKWLPVDRAMHECRHAPRRDAAGNLLPGPSGDACR